MGTSSSWPRRPKEEACVHGVQVCLTGPGRRPAARRGCLCIVDRGSLWSWRALDDFPLEARRAASGNIIQSRWRIWRERNRRTRHTVEISPAKVAVLVWEEVAQQAYAQTQDPGDL